MWHRRCSEADLGSWIGANFWRCKADLCKARLASSNQYARGFSNSMVTMSEVGSFCEIVRFHPRATPTFPHLAVLHPLDAGVAEIGSMNGRPTDGQAIAAPTLDYMWLACELRTKS